MRFARFGKLLCCLILVAIPAGAQQTSIGSTAGTQDDKAVSLLKASLAAMMVSAAAAPTTLTETGTITPLDTDGAAPYVVRIYVQGIDKFRWEKDLPNGTTATVVNGPTAQSQASSTSSPLLPWQVDARKLENFPILLLSNWLNSNNIHAHFAGIEAVNGVSLNHISIVDYSQRTRPSNPWLRDGHRGEYELYIDPATSLPVRLHYFQDTDDKHFLSLVPMDIVYSDFRTAAGSVFPFALTRYLGQTKLSVLQLQSVVPNATLSGETFAIN